MASLDFSSRSSEFPFGHATDIEPPVLRTLVASRDGLPPLGSDWLVLRLRETGGTWCLAELRPSPWCRSPSMLLGARRVGRPERLVPEPRPSGLGRVCS